MNQCNKEKEEIFVTLKHTSENKEQNRNNKYNKLENNICIKSTEGKY